MSEHRPRSVQLETDAPRGNALAGQRVAFTGRLATMTRDQAAAIVARAGGRLASSVSARVSLVVVGVRGWPLLDTGAATRKLDAAMRLRDAGRPVRIVPEQAFREMVGLDPAPAEAPKSYTPEQVAAAIGVDAAALDRWRLLGLVRPTNGLYDFRDIVSLRTVTDLVSRGVSPRVIRASLEGLRSVMPGVDRPLAQLKILVHDSGRLLAELGDALLAPGGQFELNFDRPAPPAPSDLPEPKDAPPRERTLSLARADAPRSAEEWIDAGRRLEDEGKLADAERAYRRAVRLDPSEPAAQFNLGNVLLARGRHEGAAERFAQAAALDPSMAAAWFNLAFAQEESRRPRAAIRSLRRALKADPSYADAHFNLARLFQALGKRPEAAEAWRAYLRLDPRGEWADEAYRCLEQSDAWA